MSAFQAAEVGELQIVKVWLAEQPSLINFSLDEECKTLLIIAAEKGHLDIVKFLCELAADVNASMWTDATALHVAVEYGHIEVVKFLISIGANVNQPMNDGASALVIAVDKGFEEIVRELITAGADLNWTTRFGKTPLRAACSSNQPSILQLLIDAGADIQREISNPHAPLMENAFYSGNDEIIKILIENGLTLPLVLNGVNVSPLTFVIRQNLPHVLALLLRIGVCLKANDYQKNPLFVAARCNRIGMLKLLLTYDTKIDECSIDDRMTPLHIASSLGHAEIVECLLDAGANVELLCEDGLSSLEYAANRGHAKVVRLLLDANAQLIINLIGPSSEGLVLIDKTRKEIRLDSLKSIVNQSVINPSSFFSTIDPDVTRSILEMVLERPVLRDETLLDQAWKFLTITIFFRDYCDSEISVEMRVNATVGSLKRAIAMQLYGISDISKLVLAGLPSNLKTLQEVNLSDCSTVRGFCKY